MLTALVFIATLSDLVLVHELGHFVAARWAGVKVEQFSIFFPPHVFKYQGKQTELAIGIIPLGGYNRLYGEEQAATGQGAFNRASVWRRLGIILAGVAMNVITCVLLLWFGFMVGMPPVVSTPAELHVTVPTQVLVTAVQPNSAAARAGLVVGDSVEGFATATDIQLFTRAHRGETVSLTVHRNGQTTTVQPQLGTDAIAPLGIGISEATVIQVGPLTALRLSVVETGRMIAAMGHFLRDLVVGLFVHAKLADGVTGPVGIYQVTGQAVQLGFSYVIQLAAMISLNLALINLLPIPGLDGGRALFVILEAAAGGRKVVAEHHEALIHAIGFWVLILLFLAITVRDVTRLF